MREILFKGKRTDNGGWIEGYYVCLGKYHYILTGKLDITKGYPIFVHYDVIPETVGQYTGLTDKNGKKIFEGDIGKDRGGNIHIVKYGRFTPKNFYRMFGYDTTVSIYGLHTVCDEVECMLPTNHTLEIIGNIHDNPELLKGGAE